MVIACDANSVAKGAQCFVCLPPDQRRLINISQLQQLAGLSALTPKQLLAQAAPYRPISRNRALAAEIYILATIFGTAVDGKALGKSAAGFIGQDELLLDSEETYLLAANAGNSTDPKVLAKSLNGLGGLVDQWSYLTLFLYAQTAVSLGKLSSATPNTVMNGARCLFCEAWNILKAIRAYLLCQIGLAGTINTNPNLVPPGSSYPPGAGNSEFDVPIQAGMCYQICWGTNDASATLAVSGQSFSSTGVGTCTNVYSSVDTVLQLFGAAGTTVTATVKNCSCGICVPAPSRLGLQTESNGNTVDISWDAPPAGITSTEVWTSTDNVNFNLSATVAAPGNTSTTQAQAIGSFVYVKVRWIKTAIQGPFSPVSYMSGRVSDWAKRVVNNGGALPSSKTQDNRGMSEFDLTLVSNSIDSLMDSMIVVAPDNLIAATTPLFHASGSDPWANHGFVAGDLTVNGLKGDGVAKYLNTGVNPATDGRGFERHICLYVFTGNNNVEKEFGSGDGTYTITTIAQVSNAGTCYWHDPYDGGLGQLSAANANYTGFINFVRTNASTPGSQAAQIYIASSTVAHQTLVSSSTQNFGNQVPFSAAMLAWADFEQGANSNFSSKRMSFVSTGQKMTAAQSQTFFNAIQRLRTRFGGGYV